MDRLHLIGIFVAVVDSGGFAGAARKLGISPPAVTHAINKLENHLGVRLLTRTTRVVRVTDAGVRYAEDCRRILAEMNEADEAASGTHGAPRGLLTVTAPVLFGARFVTPIVIDYLRRYPDASVSGWFLDRLVNLIDDGVDVAVRIGELPDSTMQAARVGTVRRVVCASPAYLAERGTPLTPDDLAEHTLIAARAVTPKSEWQFTQAGALRSVKVQPRLASTSNDAALAAAVAGFGLTRLLSYQVADQLSSGSLVALLQDHEPPPLPVHVAHREGRHANRKVRAFLDLAIDALRADAALR